MLRLTGACTSQAPQIQFHGTVPGDNYGSAGTTGSLEDRLAADRAARGISTKTDAPDLIKL